MEVVRPSVGPPSPLPVAPSFPELEYKRQRRELQIWTCGAWLGLLNEASDSALRLAVVTAFIAAMATGQLSFDQLVELLQTVKGG